MKKTKKFRIAILLITAFFICNSAVFAVSFFTQSKNDFQLKSEQEQKIDVSDISISDITIQKLSDEKKSEQKIYLLKKLLKEKNVPDNHKEKLELLIQNHNFNAVLPAYEFAFEHMMTYSQLEGMILQREEGTDWSALFRPYIDLEDKFTPREFEPDYLTKLVQNYRFNDEELTFSEILDYLGICSFETLIERRQNGETWNDITFSLQVVNANAMLNEITLDEEDFIELKNSKNKQEYDSKKEKIVNDKKGKAKHKKGESLFGNSSARTDRAQSLAQYYEEKYGK